MTADLVAALKDLRADIADGACTEWLLAECDKIMTRNGATS